MASPTIQPRHRWPARATTGSAVGGGAIVGIIAGVVMGLVAMLHSMSIGLGFWEPMYLIAATFYGIDATLGGFGTGLVGVLTHMVVAGFFGACFGLLVGARTSDAAAFLWGLVFAVAVWAVMTFGVLPWINEPMYAHVIQHPGWWFFFHLVFGGMLLFTPSLVRSLGRQ